MDDAFCGGPDVPSLNSTGRLVSDAVAANTAAIIWMGNPRFVGGLPFNVGSAVNGGVSFESYLDYVLTSGMLTGGDSSLPGRRGFRVLSLRTSSSHTVMPKTRSARMGTTRRCTRAMGSSSGRTLYSLSSASLKPEGVEGGVLKNQCII
jgi:hypothetical protein